MMLGCFFAWQQSVSISLSQATGGRADASAPLKIEVLAGENGLNNLKKKTAVKPVVEVRDKNNHPVAGAYVAFDAPESGAHVTFAHASSSFSTVTDARGQATVPVARPVGPGAFKIRVRATFQGKVATAIIAQTNYLTAAAAAAAGAGAAAGGAGAGGAGAAAGISATMIGVIAGVAAAGVAGAVLATRGGGKSNSSSPTGSIGQAGAPVIGPPK
jgi:hypothetical protein